MRALAIVPPGTRSEPPGGAGRVTYCARRGRVRRGRRLQRRHGVGRAEKGAGVAAAPDQSRHRGAVRPDTSGRATTAYDVAAQIDGDGQHDPSYLAAGAATHRGRDGRLVIGSRYLGTGGFRSTTCGGLERVTCPGSWRLRCDAASRIRPRVFVSLVGAPSNCSQRATHRTIRSPKPSRSRSATASACRKSPS